MNDGQREVWYKAIHEGIEQLLGASPNAREEIRQKLENVIAPGVGLPPQLVKVLKVGANEMRNVLFQGKNLSRRFRLGLLVVDEESQSDLDKFVRWAEARMKWEPSIPGFDALAVYEAGEGLTRVYYREDRPPSFLDRLRVFGPALPTPVSPPGRAGVFLPLRSSIPPEVEEPVACVIRHLEEAKNVAVQGPPMVGKTWVTRRVVDALGGSDGLRLLHLTARHKGDKCAWLRDTELAEKKLLWETIVDPEIWTTS